MEDKVLTIVSICSASYRKIPFPKPVGITLLKVNSLWLITSGYTLKCWFLGYGSINLDRKGRIKSFNNKTNYWENSCAEIGDIGVSHLLCLFIL